MNLIIEDAISCNQLLKHLCGLNRSIALDDFLRSGRASESLRISDIRLYHSGNLFGPGCGS